MRIRKVRGHTKIIRNIENWKNNNKDLDLEYLDKAKRNYCKFWVSPFCDISVSGSEIPTPKGKIRTQIIESFIEIYDSWDAQLKTLQKPYHLVLWLFENNLERSQVVCAIDDWVDFYKITFFRPEHQPKMPVQSFGKLAESLSKFNWIYAHEEGWFTKSDMDEEIEYVTQGGNSEDLKWYKRNLKSTYRTDQDANGEVTYFQKIGNIWIGNKN